MQQSPNEHSPALTTILWADFPAFMAAVFPFLFAILAIIVLFAGEVPDPRGDEGLSSGDLPYMLGFGAILILICIPVLLYRAWSWTRPIPGGPSSRIYTTEQARPHVQNSASAGRKPKQQLSLLLILFFVVLFPLL